MWIRASRLRTGHEWHQNCVFMGCTFPLVFIVQFGLHQGINNDPSKAGILPLEHRRKVASLCTFYHHFFLQPSLELTGILPSAVTSIRVTRSSTSCQPFAVTIPKSNTVLRLSSYIPRTSRLWNSLPSSVFPIVPNMASFKSAINSYLLIQSWFVKFVLLYWWEINCDVIIMLRDIFHLFWWHHQVLNLIVKKKKN